MANELSTLRTKAGLSRFQLARKMNITPNSIYNWEKGIVQPSAEAIYKMAQVLGTTTDNIFLALNTTKVVEKGEKKLLSK